MTQPYFLNYGTERLYLHPSKAEDWLKATQTGQTPYKDAGKDAQSPGEVT